MKLTAKSNTLIKSSTQQSTELKPEDIYQLSEGESFPAESVESAGNHWKITAYVYKDHFDLSGEVPEQQGGTAKDKPNKISDRGLDLLKQFEGVRLKAYRDPVGVWTIGYGHTITAEPGMRITREEAERLLRQDLERFEKAVRDRVMVPINQDQFDALVSFAFNVGVGAFRKSTLLRLLNQGNYEGAKDEFKRWVYGGGRRLAGLVKRRNHEAELFLPS
jgi:lysozyme